MNDHEVTQIVARIHLHDNRQVDELVIGHWKDTIGDLPYDAALAAVNMHIRESTAYLLPAHVRANAKRILEDQARREHLEGTTQGDWAPAPKNFKAMAEAWNDPVALARQKAIYNQQLIDEGFAPLYEEPGAA